MRNIKVDMSSDTLHLVFPNCIFFPFESLMLFHYKACSAVGWQWSMCWIHRVRVLSGILILEDWVDSHCPTSQTQNQQNPWHIFEVGIPMMSRSREMDRNCWMKWDTAVINTDDDDFSTWRHLCRAAVHYLVSTRNRDTNDPCTTRIQGYTYTHIDTVHSALGFCDDYD